MATITCGWISDKDWYDSQPADLRCTRCGRRLVHKQHGTSLVPISSSGPRTLFGQPYQFDGVGITLSGKHGNLSRAFCDLTCLQEWVRDDLPLVLVADVMERAR